MHPWVWVILTILALDRLFPEKHQSLPPWPEGGPDRLMSWFFDQMSEILGSFVWAQNSNTITFRIHVTG